MMLIAGTPCWSWRNGVRPRAGFAVFRGGFFTLTPLLAVSIASCDTGTWHLLEWDGARAVVPRHTPRTPRLGHKNCLYNIYYRAALVLSQLGQGVGTIVA